MMDLESIKRYALNQAHSLTKSRFPTISAEVEESLIHALQREDEKNAKMAKISMMFFSVAALFFSSIFLLTWIFPPDTSASMVRLEFGLFTIIFPSLGLFFRMKARRYSEVDYAEPLTVFLEKAEKRYTSIPRKDVAISLPFFLAVVVFAGLGWMTAFQRYFPSLGLAAGILAYVVLILFAAVVSGVIAFRYWKNSQAPLVNEIRRLKLELKEETAVSEDGPDSGPVDPSFHQ